MYPVSDSVSRQSLRSWHWSKMRFRQHCCWAAVSNSCRGACMRNCMQLYRGDSENTHLSQFDKPHQIWTPDVDEVVHQSRLAAAHLRGQGSVAKSNSLGHFNTSVIPRSVYSLRRRRQACLEAVRRDLRRLTLAGPPIVLIRVDVLLAAVRENCSSLVENAPQVVDAFDPLTLALEVAAYDATKSQSVRNISRADGAVGGAGWAALGKQTGTALLQRDLL